MILPVEGMVFQELWVICQVPLSNYRKSRKKNLLKHRLIQIPACRQPVMIHEFYDPLFRFSYLKFHMKGYFHATFSFF